MPEQVPLVSVVTPSFNQGRYLEQTIRSVLGQSYPRIEYLVMDGGSEDESPAIIRKYTDRLAYWQSQPDQGFADALHQGFARSTGQILAYLNADDLLAPDAVATAVEALHRHPQTVMVYGNRVSIGPEGEFLRWQPTLPIWSRSPYLGMIICQESCFWRREIYDQVGGVDATLRFAVDYDLFSKFARRGVFHHDGRIWGFFRIHPASKTVAQYRTLGKKEVAAVQDRVWGARPLRLCWLSVLCLVRVYGVCAPPFVKKPAWPSFRPRGRAGST